MRRQVRAPVTLVRAAVSLVVIPALAACETHPLDAVGLAPTTLRNDLLAHYTFDEGSGTVVGDHSGNRHDGALTGGTWISDGVYAGALHFGGNDYVTVDSFPNAPLSFSVSAWIRAASAPAGGFETVLSTEIVFDGGWQLNLETDAGLASHFAYWDSTARAYTLLRMPMPSTRWTHVVSVVDGSAQTLSDYVDGALVGVRPATHPISPGNRALLMGTWSLGKRLLVGDLDDVAIYSRALVAEEVRELEKHPPPDPL